jgi:hypothetical protein
MENQDKETLKKHKWSEHFKRENTYWQKCIKCGIYRISLCCKQNYSTTGTIHDCTEVRPDCA